MDFLRELSIGINYVEIAVEFAIFIYFLKNYLMKRISGTLLSSIGIIFLAITRSFYMVFDYYIPNFLYLLLAWIFLYSALIVLAMSLFKGVSRSIFHNFPYKRIYFSSIIVYVLILLALRQLNAIFFYICTIGIGILLAIPLLFKFNKLVAKAGGLIKRYFGLAIFVLPLAFLSLGIGSIWTQLPVYDGWILKISTHFIFLGSLVFFAIALWSLPSLNEFDWEKSLDSVHILMKSGICIYSYSFKHLINIEPEFLIDSQLMGHSLTGIIALVKEMTKSKKHLVFIKQEKKNLYLESGNLIRTSVLAEEELRIISGKIKQFIGEFEFIFSDFIQNWNGTLMDADQRKTANMLVTSIFGYREE